MKTVAAVLLMLFSLVMMSSTALAQDAKITDAQKLGVALLAAEGITALVLGPVVLPAAIATGTQEQLCAAMKGKYDPKAADQCAGGSWLRLIPILKNLRD
jgi:hypothetical protein